MKYYVQYPIYLDCNLKCKYCFSYSEMTTGLTSGGDYVGKGGPNFTIDDYKKWRDTNLADAEEILLHPHGGEPTTPLNIDFVVQLFESLDRERFEMLTNGLGEKEAYERLLPFKDRMWRVGFTYHRKVIGKNKELTKKFTKNVLMLRDWGFSVYVKELLFIDLKPQIISAKQVWNARGIDYKIQDFKGYERGEDFSEFEKYQIEDINLLDPEYVKTSNECYCLAGYKNVLIRGGWMAGDILACWIDPTVIGNIQDNTFNPNYRLTLTEEGLEVEGVPKVYKGTYGKDRYWEEKSKDYTNQDAQQKEQK